MELVSALYARFCTKAIALNGVLCRRGFLLGLRKRGPALLQLCLGLLTARGGRREILLCLPASFVIQADGVRQRRKVGLTAGQLCPALFLLAAQGQIALCDPVSGIGQALALRFRIAEGLISGLPFIGNLRNAALQRANLLRNAAGTALLFRKLLLHPLDIGFRVFTVGLQNGDLTTQALRLCFNRADRFAELVCLHIAVVKVKGQRL